jgi:hypothetical protein
MMKIHLGDLKKLESSSLPARPIWEEDETVEVIIKVRKPHYVPSDVTVRAQIDPYMFTGAIPAGSLTKLDQDPEVMSVAVGKTLRIIE